jgi:ABC-type nitrate/sulfonate/bicarbonate transport system substrate-binding protein
MTNIALTLRYGAWLVVLVLMTAPSHAEAQQKLTPVNYGTITISALHWPYLIAEQEGLLQKEGLEIKRVLGGTTRHLPGAGRGLHGFRANESGAAALC